ncbi:MAG: ClpXP protease specificity-enhancing factor [Methylococcales bacterium]|nr:ClpXP protease specificity-enhancing factor [Methylococcales bacterium]
MTPLKPYLIRGLYDWILDNEMTPYLLVNAEHPDARLPEEFIENNQIVLNIRPAAIQNLSLGDDDIEFHARFSGQPMHVVAPVSAILAIYAQENGQGMVFEPSDEPDDDSFSEDKKPSVKRPQLRIVK